MMGIYVFDIRTGKNEVISIEGLVDKGTKEILNRVGNDLGLVLKVEQIIDCEKFIERYYNRNFYTVVRLEYKTGYDFFSFESIVREYLEEHFTFEKENQTETWEDFCSSVGVPDYLIYKMKGKKIVELFFTEVKSLNDGVRFNQIKWFYRTNAPVKIIYADPEKEERFPCDDEKNDKEWKPIV